MFFSKPAQFIIIDAQGLPFTQKIDVWIAYSYEAFVLVPTDIGDAINACGDAIRARSKDQECELTFYHDSQHFSPSGLPCLVTKSVNRASPNLESASYPRLKIPQNLPCQSNSNTSSAALYLIGATYTIALDGTPDGKLCRHTNSFLWLTFCSMVCDTIERDLARTEAIQTQGYVEFYTVSGASIKRLSLRLFYISGILASESQAGHVPSLLSHEQW